MSYKAITKSYKEKLIMQIWTIIQKKAILRAL